MSEYNNKTRVEDEDVLLSSAIEGVFLNSELFGHQRGSSNIGYKKISMYTLILSTQNLHLGNANVNTRFEHGMVSPAYKTYEIRNCNKQLFSLWIKSEKAKRFFYNATTVGASQCRRNVEWDSLYEQEMILPSLAEQQKIADFLSLVDERIEKQRQLVEVLKRYKRGLLFDIFNRKIQLGNNSAWRSVMLSDCCAGFDNMRKPISSELREKGTVPYYGANGVQDYVKDYIFDGNYVLLAEDGGRFDEFYSMPIAQFITGKSWVNNHAHVLQALRGFDTKYIYYALVHKDIRKYINGSSRAKLNQEDMWQIKIDTPCFDDQKKIASFMTVVDNMINQHEFRLAKLTNLKKAFLQQMFI